MLKGLQYDEQLAEDYLDAVVRPILAGYLPGAYKSHLAGRQLGALSKFPKEGLRPIMMGDQSRGLVAKALAGVMGPAVGAIGAYLQHTHPRVIQLGNASSGVLKCFHLLDAISFDAAAT